MACFVHVGFDPKPHEASDSENAILYAVNRLNKKKILSSNDNLKIYWRRDDLYPDNFLEFNLFKMISFLESFGEVVLQLASFDNNGLPIMGEIVNILTSAKENKNTLDAQAALSVCGKSEMYPAVQTVRSRRKSL